MSLYLHLRMSIFGLHIDGSGNKLIDPEIDTAAATHGFMSFCSKIDS
jgi:hypothetical protein